MLNMLVAQVESAMRKQGFEHDIRKRGNPIAIRGVSFDRQIKQLKTLVDEIAERRAGQDKWEPIKELNQTDQSSEINDLLSIAYRSIGMGLALLGPEGYGWAGDRFFKNIGEPSEPDQTIVFDGIRNRPSQDAGLPPVPAIILQPKARMTTAWPADPIESLIEEAADKPVYEGINLGVNEKI